MKIEKNTVAVFSYILSNSEGEELERSSSDEPTAYLHGHGNILFNLERHLEGHAAGDTLEVDLSAVEAYGRRHEEASQRVPIKHLLNTGKGKLRIGSLVKINTEQGPRDARVIKLGRFNVDIDTNHPLAGVDLHFSIVIRDVRQATAEEVAHGHAHGIGGHHH